MKTFIEAEFSVLNPKELWTIQAHDFTGNKTKNIGLNTPEAISQLIEILKDRLKQHEKLGRIDL